MKKLSLLLFTFLIVCVKQTSSGQCFHEMNETEHRNHLLHLKEIREGDFIKRRALMNVTQWVPLKIHMIRQSDGSGGKNLQDLANSVLSLNEQFDSINVQFYVCGDINYIDNSTYFNYDNTQPETILPSSFYEAGKVNLIYCNSIQISGFGSAGGFASFPGGPLRIYLSSTNITTLIHEMGHFYGLPHTFSNSDNSDISRRELVTRGAGANCTTAGDGLCGTPADPYIRGTHDSYFSDCVYDDTIYDSNGDRFEPMINNFMSYYNGCSKEYFVQDQFDLMASYLSSPSRSSWVHDCPSINAPTNLVGSFDPQQGLNLSWQDNSTNELGFIVEYKEDTWTNFKQATFVSKNVTSTLFGKLRSNTSYTFRIKPFNVVDGFSNEFSYTTGNNIYCFPYHVHGCLRTFSTMNTSMYSIKEVKVDSENNFSYESECGLNGYNLYENEKIIVYQNLYYTLTAVQQKNTNGSTVFADYDAWIDLNENEFFEESERLEISNGFSERLISLHFDESVTPGTKRLRIKISNDPSDPCDNIDYGETEDYLVEILEYPNTVETAITAEYLPQYKGKVSLTSSMPSNTQYLLYQINPLNKTFFQDTVLLSDLEADIMHTVNGNYKYFLKTLDGIPASNITSIEVDQIEYCPSFSREGCTTENGKSIQKIIVFGETLMEDSTTCSSFGYEHIDATPPEIFKNLAYEIHVSDLVTTTFNFNDIFLWIDLNDDKVFSNNERFDFTHSNKELHIAQISINDSITPGIKQARIALNSWSTPEACDVLPRIDVRDFEINIKEAPTGLPVNVSVTQTGPYVSEISWNTSGLSSNTDYELYRITSESEPKIISTFNSSSQNFAQDIILTGSKHTYYIREKETKELVSNVAFLTIDDFQLPFTLEVEQVNQMVRLSWNLNEDFPSEKVSVSKTSFNNPNYTFYHIDSVRTRKGIYDDFKIKISDDGNYYVLKSNENTEISNQVGSSPVIAYCQPSFTNTECLDPLTYFVRKSFKNSGATFFSSTTLKNDPYCSSNKFVEDEFSRFYDADSILQETDSLNYSASLYLEFACEEDNLASLNKRNVKLWVDFNEDGTFSNNEIMYQNESGEFLCQHNFPINMSNSYNSGYKRTRLIISDENESINDPCGSYTYGTGFDQIFYFEGQDVLISTHPDHLNLSSEITIFPNPSQDGYFTIDTKLDVESITITNVLGETIYQGEYSDVDKLGQGLYLLSIQVKGTNHPVQKSFIVH